MFRTAAYVDGFNLYYGMKSRKWRRYYWLDVRRLAGNLLRSDQRLTAVKYFTALVSSSPRDRGKSKRQTTYLEALELNAQPGIFYGHYLAKENECLQCGAKWQTHEEKMTDVNIATEMLRDAYANACDTFLLISADSDLTPPVRHIKREFPDKRVVVAFPPNRRSDQLKIAADAAFTIGRKKLADSQLPAVVQKPNGHILKRPSRWR